MAAIVFADSAPPPLYTNTTPKIAVQSTSAVSPTAGKSRCDTRTGTKGVFQKYTATGYRDMEYKVFGNYSITLKAYPPVTAKVSFNNEAAYMPESSGRITGNSGLDTIVFTMPSTAKKTVNFCIRR